MSLLSWTRIPIGLSDVLSIVLVIRLVFIGLHDVYRVFCAFLLLEVATTSIALFVRFSRFNDQVDYRILWMVLRVGPWIVSIWMVYALLRAILTNYPGILRASRRALNIVLPVSLAITLLSAGPEYFASGASEPDAPIVRLASMAIILERVISTLALLILLMMLAFILWFPIKMPRNLAVFSIGFFIYFGAKTSLILLRNFWSHESLALLTTGVNSILCACLLSWTFFLTKAGESVPVTIGQSWRPGERKALVHDLDALNALLAQVSRRP